MTDHDALLAAICANPRDDLPRLVYADWLEESGQPERARFIRTEVAIYQRPEWDPERVRYEEAACRNSRNSGIPESWVRDVGPTLPEWCEWGGIPKVRRGFPWAMRVTRPGWLAHRSAELIGQLPVEQVEFREVTRRDIERLVAISWFPRLTGLRLSGRAQPVRVFDALLACPALAGIERLAVSLAPVDDAEVSRFAISDLFGALKALHLERLTPRLCSSLFEAIGQRGTAVRMCSLSILSSQCGDVGFDQLADPRLLAGLHRLYLVQTCIGADRVRRLAESPGVANLRVLSLGLNGFGNAGAVAIATSPHLANLLVLNLGYCQVGDDGIRAILDSPLADRLVLLDLTGSPASAEMKQELRARMGERVRL